MHTFPPDWKPDYAESFIAGLHLGSAIANRGFPADEHDAITWQIWTQTPGNKMAFARGFKCSEAYTALRKRPAPNERTPEEAR